MSLALTVSLETARKSGLSRYFNGEPCPKGHIDDRYTSNQSCAECARIASRDRTRLLRSQDQRYRLERRNYLREKRKDPEYVANIRAIERSKYREDANYRTSRLNHSLEYRAKSAARILSRNVARRAGQGQRTPVWANLYSISEFYGSCPDGFHVDHVVPLHGRTVSGLHVIENLQYLPAMENIIKGNKFETVT